ncbi:hypothetical protein F4778DRAFT_637611 [Xylariomycetidae sp. FL2044]|nr:hypothetical protein F4778DRAFT_637611 [Xylariomycetidae sp. FL2044]
MEKQASLLGIPREVRQCIYAYTIHQDLDCEVVKVYKDCWRNRSFATRILHDPDFKFSVPWVNLLLTCTVVRAELHDYMNSPSIHDAEESCAYVMDITAMPAGLGTTTWRHIPCRPSQATKLVVNMHFHEERIEPETDRWHGVDFWGCGGPRGIVRQLYQTLNLLLHYGPALWRQTLLHHPMRLKTMILNVTTKRDWSQVVYKSLTPVPTEIRAEISGPGRDLSAMISTLIKSGLLWGYVDKIELNDALCYREFGMDEVADARLPAYWNGYGFEWGTKASVHWETYVEGK